MFIKTEGKVQALIPQRLISDVQAAPEVSLHHDQPLPASRVRVSQVLPGDSPYPEFAVPVEGSQQFDDVGVVAGGQDLDLHHVILQLILALGLDDLGSCQSARFLVLGLQDKTRVSPGKVRRGRSTKFLLLQFLPGSTGPSRKIRRETCRGISAS